ncbi:hypothetical protein JJB07_18440 [Tumebacillus sp. ITR2]|jgi:hypothetical protein|uniref:Preprotein translocase subunit YajC n=1 Tax=Tumebacillus amylolyticus TaxID=2801339 RepID=A0ABS1JE91_9BACL|nr:hypothetical protein [Tumebacillus amylolyticus]MBL0388587.1 hypothetical protein [Tumebacillus amylolyticus]
MTDLNLWLFIVVVAASMLYLYARMNRQIQDRAPMKRKKKQKAEDRLIVY